MISIKVLFFAKSRDLSGCSSVMLDLENESITGSDLVEMIIKKYPR